MAIKMRFNSFRTYPPGGITMKIKTKPTPPYFINGMHPILNAYIHGKTVAKSVDLLRLLQHLGVAD